MSTFRSNRRDFLKTAGAAAAATSLPYWFTSDSARALAFQAANDRPVVGCIGTGSRWEQIVKGAMQFGDVVAVCDVDEAHSGKARDSVKEEQGKKGRDAAIDVYGDYRKILERKDIDIVTIVTPDHWHSKIAIEAMKAGKDIYCEKPLTLTIDEGKQIIKVLNETKRVFQVGTQQRTEMNQRFLQAIALIQAGRIGKVKKVQCAIGGAPVSGPLKVEAVPAGLNWDMWLGQTPVVDYIPRRCHYEFRWWYEYSGGKMTDWGAHHVDIAQWAIGMQNSGPTSIEGTAKHPVPFEKGYPTAKDEYNAASEFLVTCKFPNDVEMVIRHDTDNGILFEGTEGTFFVNRGKIEGKPVEDLKSNPLPEDAIDKVYGGKKPTSHMENFFQCVVSRGLPISDVFTHHRAMTTCHLANIAIRLGRPLKWDPETEQIVGDEEARGFQAREQRKGYEIEA